jgi:hypothetical protein
LQRQAKLLFTFSCLTLRQSLSMKMLSNARPRPSILMAISRSLRIPVNAQLMNCEPWLVLKISGRAAYSEFLNARGIHSPSLSRFPNRARIASDSR